MQRILFMLLTLLSTSIVAQPTPIPSPTPTRVTLTITFDDGMQANAVGARLFDQAEQPTMGSLTSPSIVEAEQNLERTPGAVGLVPAEVYENTHARTLKDMVGTVPGVYAEKRFGEEVRLSIRGSGVGRGFHLRGIELLQDGVSINLADGSGDFQEIDPLISRYVEVYKGGNGLQYGSSTLGGAINILTPSGRTLDSRDQLRIEAGTNDFYRLHVNKTDATDKADYFIAATGIDSNGYREQSEQTTGRVSGNVGVRISDTIENRTYVTYNHIDQEVPGTVSYQKALHDPQYVLPIVKTREQARDIRSTRVINKTTFWIDNQDKFDVGVYAAHKDLFHPISVLVDQEAQDVGAFARYEGSVMLGDYRNRFVIGSRVKQGDIDAEVFTNVNGSPSIQTGKADQMANQYDVYAQNDFFITQNLSLVAAAQWVKATREVDNQLFPAQSDSKDYVSFNPKMGVVWDVTPNAQLFANVSRSDEAPTFSELVQVPVLGFVPLDSQRAWTAEVGSRGQADRLAWDIAFYHSDIRGELLNYTVTPNTPASTFNAGNTQHQGVELGFDIDVGRKWLFANNDQRLILRQQYMLNDFQFENDAQYGDNEIAGIPRQILNTQLRYEYKTWSVTPGVEWAPEGAYADYANTFKADGYEVLNLNIVHELTPTIDVYADVRNVLDERYVSSMTTVTNYSTVPNKNIFYPGDGRGVFLGMKVDF